MNVKIENFRAAMRAALEGPERKDVEWTASGHDFNVKKVAVKRVDGGIEIDGTDGKHISHRLRFRPDDQIFYKCKVRSDGTVTDLEVNVKSSFEVLKEWLAVIGKIKDLLSDDEGKSDDVAAMVPVPGTDLLLDGSWRGDAEFLIANVIAYSAARALPELKDGQPDRPDFLIQATVLHPAIAAQFHHRIEAAIDR